MNILIMTNTYLPLVGGVERSIENFSNEFQKLGHNVLIVCPQIHNMPNEKGVIRIPAIQNFNGTEFPISLPIPNYVNTIIKNYKPEIIHANHPFMMGDSALRLAAKFDIPIVYTFHSFFEHYTHYIPGNIERFKSFIIHLSTGFANLCDRVFSPSTGVASELRRRGVHVPIDIVPSGVNLNIFMTGDGNNFRKKYNIPMDAFLIGFVSRLAIEKNLDFLSKVICRYLSINPNSYFVIVGKGPLELVLKEFFFKHCDEKRVIFTGKLENEALSNAYHAMDVFAFASISETQGLVLIEALTSGVPVIALQSLGINDVIKDYKNGRLIKNNSYDDFCKGLDWFSKLSYFQKILISSAAKTSAKNFSSEHCALRAIKGYEKTIFRFQKDRNKNKVDKFKRRIEVELMLLNNLKNAASGAIKSKLAA